MFKTNKEYWEKRYAEMEEINVVGRYDWDEKRYKRETTRWGNIIRKVLEKRFNKLKQLKPDKPRQKKKVLDFGCGIGRWAPFLSDYFDDYHGVDIMPNNDRIMTNLPWYNDVFFTQINDDGTFELQDSEYKFDLVWTCVSLQHIMDEDLLKYYINRFYEELKDDGYVLITENTLEHKPTKYITFRSEQQYEDLFVNSSDVKFSLVAKSGLNSSKEPHSIMMFKKEI